MLIDACDDKILSKGIVICEMDCGRFGDTGPTDLPDLPQSEVG